MRNAPGAKSTPLSLCRAVILVSLGCSLGCHATGHHYSSRSVASSACLKTEAPADRVLNRRPSSAQTPVRAIAYRNDDASANASPAAALSLSPELPKPDATLNSLGEFLVQETPQSASNASDVDKPLAVPDDKLTVEEKSDALTLEKVEAMALASHPAVAEARARVRVATGQYVQSGLPFNPLLRYQSQEIGNDEASGLHSVSMVQQIVTANKLGLAQQVRAQEIQQARAQLRIARLQVLTRVRAAFAETVVAQRRAALTDQIVEVAEKSVASVKALFRADEVSRIAWLQARVEAEQARLTAENAKAEYSAKRRTLAAATGVSASAIGSLAATVEDQENLPEPVWEELIAEIRRTSPEIAAAGSELQRARWALRLACAQTTPNVTGQLGVGYGGASDDTFASVGVSVPLPIRNRNQGNIRSARAQVDAAAAAIEQARLSLDRRLAAAVGRYQVARQRFQRLKTSVIPDAEETFVLSRQAFAAGETDYRQLLTAQKTLFNTRLTMLDALSEAKIALTEIEGLLVTIEG